MNRKTIFFLIKIYILGIFLVGNVCNAASLNPSIDGQVKNLDTNHSEHNVNLHFDSSQIKCILLDNSNEEEQSKISSSKLSPINFITFYTFSFDPISGTKWEGKGLLERNITPVQNVSRNILFHSLQIHF